MSIEERQRKVRQHGYCQNCLARSHGTDDCTSSDVCQMCGWAHHTLLHQTSRRIIQPPRIQQAAPNRHQPRRRQRSQQMQPRNQQERSPSHPRRTRSAPRNDTLPANRDASPRRILREALRALSRLQKSLR